jgi:hypothetical protein
MAAPTLAELSDGDDLPEGKEFKITPRALSSRVARGAEKKLKEMGLQSWEEIDAMKEKIAAYEAQQEEARLSQLSEVEREKELRAKTEARLAELQNEVTTERENRMMDREEQRVTSWVDQYIDPKFKKYAMSDVLDAINAASESEIADPDAFLKGYLEKYIAEEQPGFARGAAMQRAPEQVTPQAAPAPAPVAPRAVPMTNGLQLTKPLPNAQQTLAGKTAKPGQPNSMSPAELMAYKKANGLTY